MIAIWSARRCFRHAAMHRVARKRALQTGRTHINGIEAFWSFTKRRLAKFNGVRSTFSLHLKECEWRYKRDHDQLEKGLKALIRNDRNSWS